MLTAITAVLLLDFLQDIIAVASGHHLPFSNEQKIHVLAVWTLCNVDLPPAILAPAASQLLALSKMLIGRRTPHSFKVSHAR